MRFQKLVLLAMVSLGVSGQESRKPDPEATNGCLWEWLVQFPQPSQQAGALSLKAVEHLSNTNINPELHDLWVMVWPLVRTQIAMSIERYGKKQLLSLTALYKPCSGDLILNYQVARSYEQAGHAQRTRRP